MNYPILLVVLLTISMSLAQEIAITIDDAPLRDTPLFSSADRTQLLIDNLTNAEVPDALIFVITKNLSEFTVGSLEAYREAGFHIANHSHNHFSANDKDADVYTQDMTQAHVILSEFEHFLPFYRYPYLHEGGDRVTRERIRDHLQSLGYENAYVTVDNYEWYMDALLQTAVVQGKDIDYAALRDVYVTTMWDTILFYDNIARETLGRSPKHVLLLHETDLTALYIADLVTHIRAQGWTIISPQEAYTDPLADILPDVLLNEQGRVAAVAREQGWEPSRLRHESENEDYLQELFERQRVFR